MVETTLRRNQRTGFYELRFSEKQPNGAWRSKTVSCRTADRVAALAFQRAFEAGEAQLKALPVAGVTVQELVDSYKTHRVAAQGITDAQLWSLKPVEAFFGSMEPSAIGLSVIQTYTAQRMTTGRKVKSGTVRRELGALVAVLNWAVKMKLLDKDHVPAVELPPSGQARRNIIPPGEVNDFLNAAFQADWDIYLFVGIALETAARVEAIETLTWAQIDLAAGTIDFKDVSKRATKKQRVLLPMSSRLKTLLEDQTLFQTGRLFPSRVRKRFVWWVKTTKWPHIRPHDLRRTWISAALSRGVAPALVAQVSGDSLEVIMKHYAVFLPGQMADAVEKGALG